MPNAFYEVEIAMPNFAILTNDNGYQRYTKIAAELGNASVPKIKNGIEKKLFEFHNAEPLNRFFELPLKSIWFKKCIDDVKLKANDENYFILYESFHMTYSKKLIKHIRRRYPKSKCIFLFTNPANDYNLKRLKKIQSKLDGIVTFVKEDADKYGFIYCHADLFQLNRVIKDDLYDESDVFFVGANKGRLPLLISIFEKFKNAGLKCDFWITDVPKESQQYADEIHYNQRISYDEVLQHDIHSKVILELLQDGKQYYSIRTLEALQLHKKLLTMNKTVVEQSFYDPNVIQVFDSADDISLDFVNSTVDEKIYDAINIGTLSKFEEIMVNTMTKIEGAKSSDAENKSLADLYRGGGY